MCIMPSSPITVPEDKLRKAAVDVAYEFKMFREARNRYMSPIRSVAGAAAAGFGGAGLGHNDSRAGMPLPLSATTSTFSPTYTAYLDRDALLIHTRVLMDFFYGAGGGDDVLAHHFTGATRRSVPPWPKAFRIKCNKLFAHLTYERTARRDRDEHHWYDIPVKEIEAEITKFLNSLTPERQEWFQVV